MRLRIFVSILFSLLPLGIQAADLESFVGKPVHYIRIESQFPVDKYRALEAIDIPEGTKFSQHLIRKSLRNLSLLNLYRQVSAFIAPFQDGVMLTFRFDPEQTVGSLIFKGKHTGYLFAGLENQLSFKEILRVCRLSKGSVFSEKKLTQSENSIKKLYFTYGYGNCKITHDIIPIEGTRKVKVVLKIDRGHPTRVAAIKISGNKSIPTSRLLRKLKSKVGRRFAENNLDTDRTRLRNYYRRKGFLEVTIRRPTYEYNPETNSIVIEIDIVEHDRTKLELDIPWHLWNLKWWVYHFELKPMTILEVLGLSDTDEIDEDLLLKSPDFLEKTYKSHGYGLCNAYLDIKKISEGTRLFRYRVDENKLTHVKTISLKGNSAFTDSRLKKLILTKTGGVYKENVFLEDCRTIESYYRFHGFNKATVKSEIHQPDKSVADMALTVAISEGKQDIINSIMFSGAKRFTDAELREILGMKTGEGYNRNRIENRVNTIISKYMQLGYPDIQIEFSESHPEEETLHELQFRIFEGYYTEIGKTIFQGNFKSSYALIEKPFLEIKDKPFNVLTIQSAQTKLSQTGLFSSVHWETLESEKFCPKRNLVVSLTERPTLFLETAPGYNTDIGLNGYLGFFTNSLFGTNRYLGSSVFLSNLTEKSQITYREPNFAGYPIQMEIRLFRKLTDEDTYRLFKYGGKVNWTVRLNKKSRILLEYRLDEDKPLDITPGANIPDKYRDTIRIGSLAPTFLYDSRDDPRDPHSGHLFSAKIEFARPVYNSEVNFTKTQIDALQFIHINHKQTLGLALRFGWGRDLPYQEKFKLGGIKTIRGWGYEDINGTSFNTNLNHLMDFSEIGGNTFLLGNIELRIPIFWGLMNVVFLDIGNVWDSLNDISTNDLKATAGLGLRFMTPIGPVGLDYGYNIQRNDNDPHGRWSFIIGHTF